MTGLDLMVARRRAGLRQVDVAIRMGVHRNTVTALEARERPDARSVARFLEAIARDSLSVVE